MVQKYEKNINAKQYPASITKILTALIVIEECNLTDEVLVSKNAVLSVPAGASIAYLKAGETFTVEQLLYALLIPSGNEVANVLAEYVSGSVSEFAKKMNERAKQLGATENEVEKAWKFWENNGVVKISCNLEKHVRIRLKFCLYYFMERIKANINVVFVSNTCELIPEFGQFVKTRNNYIETLETK